MSLSSSQSAETTFRLSKGIEEFTLENGLKVFLKPVLESSAVSTWIFYRVGSRNEKPGITGASHWCEHMMFKGGGRLGKGEVHALVSAEGGRNNAFTDHDLTAYYETLPKQKLDTALFIESERMTNSAFNPEEVESERHVIISEREGAENYPAYQVREEIYATAFRNHPYRWPVVGWKHDLQQMTRDELYEHYRKFYHPNNASLVICGNFNVREASRKITELFSGIPAREKIPKILSGELEQRGERTSKIIQPGTVDYVGVAYRVPEITHEDIPSLIVLSAVLGGWRGLIGFFGDRFVPKTNRLYRRLVEGKIASEINTYFPVNVDPCLLYFELMLIPGVATLRAKDELFSEIQRIEDVPPSESELRVAFNQIRSWHAYENDGISLQALSIGFMYTMGDKDLSDNLIENSLRVSPEGVQRAAKRYLSEKNRVVCEYQSIK